MSPSVSVRLLLTQSDARLVAFAHAGHERAFEALVQRYRRQLLGYCRRLLLSPERAEDALQQALLQAWLSLRAGTEVSDVKPWLYRIVHNSALNTLRVGGYDYCKLSESLSGADAPEADLDRRIAVREALAGLAALPEMQREALLRTAVEGRTHQQVARDLGLSENALRGLVYRARSALRTAASALMPPPLLTWALGSGGRGAPVVERIAELGAGGGSAGVAALLIKGGAVAVTASVLAGGIATVHTHAGTTHGRGTAHMARHPKPSPTPVAVATTHPTSVIRARARVTPRAQTRGTRSPVHQPPVHQPPVHQPRLQAKRVKPQPSTVPFTTAIVPPSSPPPAPADAGRSDGHQGTSNGGGDHNGVNRSGSSGPTGGVVSREGDPGSTIDHGDPHAGHPALSPEHGGEATRGSGHDGGASPDRTSGSPGEEPADSGSPQRAGPSSRASGQGTATSDPRDSHDRQSSSGLPSPAGTNGSSKDRQESLEGPSSAQAISPPKDQHGSSGAPTTARANSSPKDQQGSPGTPSTGRTNSSSKDPHSSSPEGRKGP